MSWFEDQINARRNTDRTALNEAYEAAVNAVIGESFSFAEAIDDIDAILKHYHLEHIDIPEAIKDDNEKLSAVCRTSGLMQRPVKLTEGWYKNAFGAFLCRFKDDDEYVAVVPGKFSGYSFYDKKNHRHVRLNKKNAKLLKEDAICFYRPFPSRELNIKDVVLFGILSWNISDYILTIGLLAVTTLLGLLVPKLSNFLLSTVLDVSSVSLLLSTIIFMASVQLSMALLSGMQKIYTARTSTKMSAAVQSASMMRLISLPVDFFRSYSSGEIMTRMQYIELLSTQIVSVLFSTSLTALFSLAYITQIFNFASALVIPSLCIISANVVLAIYTTYRQIKISGMQMQLSAKNYGTAVEMVSGIQKIKMSGSEKRMFARYTKAYSEQAKLSYNPPFYNKYNTVISTAISYVGTLVIYYAAVGASVDVSSYYAFQTSYGMISAAISALVGVALQIATFRPCLEMAKPILTTVPENDNHSRPVVSLSGSIEVNNVSFAYDDHSPNVLNDISLKIKAGQYVAIVGKTGCGKSTLLRLLLGFEKPQKGSIYYDGIDLNLLEKRSLRQKIGVVMQDDKLFNGDIYSNIVISIPTLGLDGAWEAAELAGIADDIREMPMGMHTMISEGSGSISGGQRQRLVIARAVAPKPKILFFDEATSALDNITQKKISDALDGLKCTRLIIAHRLSTIRNCDRILVMDGGRIIEDGTYDSLIAQNGFFADLVSRQRNFT